MDDFSQLVRQYIDLVYSAARRQVRDAEMAQDVTQAVFIILQQKYKSIPTGHPLSAWLLKTTSYCAANARRAKTNRDYHERRAGEMAQIERERGDSSDSSWEELSPLLDEGLNKLRAKDRDALLLRFFEKKSVREVGAALGISEEAAGKRLARAVERLRDFFQRRGATVSAVGLATLLAAESTQAAPVALAGTVTAAGATAATTAVGTTTAGAVAKGALVMMAAEKLKVAAIGAGVLLLGVGGGAVVVNSLSNDTVKVPVKPAVALERPVLAATSDWVVQFEGGATATILGINDATPTGSWWMPDGSIAADPPVDMPLDVSIPAGQRAVQVVVRFDDTADRAVTAQIDPSATSNATATVSRGRSRFLRWVGAVEPNRTNGDLVLAVRGLESTNELQFSADSAGQPTTFGDAQLKAVRQENGEAVVDMVLPPNVLASRQIVAVVEGREIMPRSAHPGLSLEASYTFPALKGKIDKIIYREGKMETVRLKNISLRAGQSSVVEGLQPVMSTPTFPVEFSDGSIVEILGITDPQQPGKWWTANGLPSTRPIPSNIGGPRVSTTANQQQRNIVVRMKGKLVDQNLLMQLEGSRATATGASNDGKTMIVDQVAALPKSLKKTALELYKSSGPFRVDETFTFAADATTQPAARIRSVTEVAGKVEAKIRIGNAKPRRDELIVAVLKDGREVRVSQMAGDSAAQGINRHTFNCKLDQVDRVEIKSRDMEAVAVNNIVLDPNEPPTGIVVHRMTTPAEGKATPVTEKAP